MSIAQIEKTEKGWRWIDTQKCARKGTEIRISNPLPSSTLDDMLKYSANMMVAEYRIKNPNRHLPTGKEYAYYIEKSPSTEKPSVRIYLVEAKR